MVTVHVPSWTAAVTLKRRIELLMALPLPSLDRLALTREAAAIGKH